MQVRFIRDIKERQRILQTCHSDVTSGHLWFKKTMARINQRFYWPGLVKDVHELVCINSHLRKALIPHDKNVTIMHIHLVLFYASIHIYVAA